MRTNETTTSSKYSKIHFCVFTRRSAYRKKCQKRSPRLPLTLTTQTRILSFRFRHLNHRHGNRPRNNEHQWGRKRPYRNISASRWAERATEKIQNECWLDYQVGFMCGHWMGAHCRHCPPHWLKVLWNIEMGSQVLPDWKPSLFRRLWPWKWDHYG